ncbi:uncharacterized protein LOC141529218 isoform X3 [Cotesia typhae]|uniref:uncharacterized protein LOC141529218 isoform X3 n=1 Tax=Cotesia typhae TaxID=2053667 RepID=UPI003D6833E5
MLNTLMTELSFVGTLKVSHFLKFKRFNISTVVYICWLLPWSISGEHGKQYKLGVMCENHFLRDLYRKIDGAVLTSQNEHNLDCTITFQTHSILQRFMLRFDRLQLDCNDHLFIYDGAHAVSSFKADLSCRNTHISVGAIYTRTNFVTLKYVTDAWGTDTNGFRLVITAVKDPKALKISSPNHASPSAARNDRRAQSKEEALRAAPGITDPAIRNNSTSKHACKDFRCSLNEFCIDEDLVCDTVNHCGDGSDEAPSALCTDTKTSMILGIQKSWVTVVLVIITLIILSIIIGVATCICKKYDNTPGHPHNTLTVRANNPANFPLQKIYGSNGINNITTANMTGTKETAKILDPTIAANPVGMGIGSMGVTTLPRSGNWLHPAGLMLGRSGVWVRLYCQEK